MDLQPGAKIIIIGAGISGITAAYYLQSKYQVTLLEKDQRLGGHTNTIAVADPDLGSIGIDTGFIVLNDRSYPTLHNFFSKLGVAVRYSDMSFSVVCEQSGLVYGSKTLRSILGRPSNLLKYSYYRMLLDFPRFWRLGKEWLQNNPANNMSVAEFVRQNRLSPAFVQSFILPMGAAIWSSPDQKILEFPIRFFLRFFLNHGMLTLSDQPRWQTVVGGSWQYLKDFARAFSGTINIATGAASVKREENGVVVTLENGEKLECDHIVLATHADQSLKLLADADDLERSLLSSWDYQTNRAVLHYDNSFLPSYVPARASWNYRRSVVRSGQEPVSITYYMNLLQGIESKRDYCVTLNPEREIDPAKIIYSIDYQHPQYSLAAEKAQAQLPEIESHRRTSFCGSYFGFGFHEDGCKSGVAVARRLGVEV